MTVETALEQTFRILAAVTVVQSFEFLAMRRRLDPVWPWGHSWFWEAFRLAGAAALIYSPLLGLVMVSIAHTNTLIRFRGSYNGGSDALYLHILIALWTGFLATVWVFSVQSVQGSGDGFHYGLKYLAFILVFSYVSSGVRKLKEPGWRNGESLRTFLQSKDYQETRAERFLSFRAKSVSWAVILFEVSFPLALFAPKPYFGLAVIFHLGNAYTFGLNRFFWTWMATYPALFYVAETLRA